MEIWGLENLNPVIFMQTIPVSIELRKQINFGTQFARGYISTRTIVGQITKLLYLVHSYVKSHVLLFTLSPNHGYTF